jgi:high-affinity nickel-transport protein
VSLVYARKLRALPSSISLIEILGLIGENCSSCLAAQEHGGLAGGWWNAWAQVRSGTPAAAGER